MCITGDRDSNQEISLFLDGINFHTGWFSIHNDMSLVPSVSYMLHSSCCDQDTGLRVKLNC